MHNALGCVDACGISSVRSKSCWIFFPNSKKTSKVPHHNSEFLFKVCSLIMVPIIINKSHLIVFFCRSFFFHFLNCYQPTLCVFSFVIYLFISQKHRVNTGSWQPVCGWYTSNMKPYREYVDSLHWFTEWANYESCRDWILELHINLSEVIV